jgi:hypothetical protein
LLSLVGDNDAFLRALARAATPVAVALFGVMPKLEISSSYLSFDRRSLRIIVAALLLCSNSLLILLLLLPWDDALVELLFRSKSGRRRIDLLLSESDPKFLWRCCFAFLAALRASLGDSKVGKRKSSVGDGGGSS